MVRRIYRVMILLLLAGFLYGIPAGSSDKGADLFSSQDYAGAISWYTSEISGAEPEDKAALYNNVGVSYMKLGNTGAARESFLQAVTSDPTYGRGYINLGVVEEKTGNTSSALEAYLQAAGSDPALSSEARVKAANLLALAGKLDEAVKTYQEAEPGAAGHVRSDLYNGLGAVYVIRKEYEKAEEAFKNSIDADPSNAALAHLNLGIIRITQGRPGDAEQEFGAAVEQDPEGKTKAREYLASIREMMNQTLTGPGSS